MTSRWEVRHGAGAAIGAERARHVMLELGTDSEMLTAHGISPWLGWSERPQGPAFWPAAAVSVGAARPRVRFRPEASPAPEAHWGTGRV